MDRSEGVPNTSASAKAMDFGDRVAYLTANLRSNLKEETVEKFVDKYWIVSNLYGV